MSKNDAMTSREPASAPEAPGAADDSASGVERQREYYRATALDYDSMHECVEHFDALAHTIGYLRLIGAESVLDTGCGTGLAFRTIQRALPDIALRGNDASQELLKVATERHGIPASLLDHAPSDALPYDTGSFDAVVETGVLHHVPNPTQIVSEMLRVARKAIFISDSNMYAQGSVGARAVKLGLARVGLLDAVNRLRRDGHDWYYTDGDGVGWSYSIFDSYPDLVRACAQVVVIPTGEKERGADRLPVLFASHCLLAGFKEPIRRAVLS